MRSPACDASGWLVTTMPRRAMTSDRLWAGHPSARSPRMAEQNTGAGFALHDVSGSAGRDCPETAPPASAAATTATAAALTRLIPSRPPGSPIRDLEAAVVTRAELDPRPAVAGAEIEIRNERVRKVLG